MYDKFKVLSSDYVRKGLDSFFFYLVVKFDVGPWTSRAKVVHQRSLD